MGGGIKCALSAYNSVSVDCMLVLLCGNLEQYITCTYNFCHSIFWVCLHFFQAFLDACETDNVGVVLELLECGADPNQADKVRGILSTVPICPLVDDIASTGWCNCSLLGQ